MLALTMLMVLLLSACGAGEPARPSSADNTQRTAEIARAFAGDGDLAKASAALGELQVANERQWLVLVTEQAIDGGQDAETTTALAKLAVALNLESTLIHTYAEQNGLAPQAEIAAAPEPTAVTAPTDTPPPAAEPAAEPTAEATLAATAEVTPTSAAEPLVALALPTPTAANVAGATGPTARANDAINVRSGPGLDYPIIDLLDSASTSAIVGKNAAGDWLEVDLDGATGWVYAPLVTTDGDLGAVAVAADIPTPPPTVEQPTPAPAEPAATATPTPAPVPAGPDFRLVGQRLWDVYENGGAKDGPSVTCGAKRELHVVVLDAGGNRLNGVAVQALLGAKETIVTGSQGKGDGQSEFVLGGGQDLTIARDADGREVTSDVAYGQTTDPRGIPFEKLIEANYCSDPDQCNAWVNDPDQPPPCYGHYSWTVTFQRSY